MKGSFHNLNGTSLEIVHSLHQLSILLKMASTSNISTGTYVCIKNTTFKSEIEKDMSFKFEQFDIDITG